MKFLEFALFTHLRFQVPFRHIYDTKMNIDLKVVSNEVPSRWQKCFSSTYQQPYWCDVTNGASTWTCPEGVAESCHITFYNDIM
jgi:hypothetical protein